MASGAFAPDQARAARLSSGLDSALLGSMRHLAEACAGAVPSALAALARLEQSSSLGPPRPAHYGLHFQLLDVIASEDVQDIANCWEFLARLAPAPPGGVSGLEDDELGALYRRNVDVEEDRPLHLAMVPAASVVPARSLTHDAVALLQQAAPAFAAETAALAREIILAADGPGAPQPFYGASSALLHGAVFFNPLRHATAVQAAETIVHESAHMLLNALTMEQPLVRNPRTARYRGPLRPDPRPMDAVYHATFVLARTILFHRAAATSRALDAAGRQAAAEAARRDAPLFEDGLSAIRRDGDLSDVARALLDDAARFILQH